MKKILIIAVLTWTSGLLYAQDYPNWPADKPETSFIEQSKSRKNRIDNLVLPQEVDMQDRMRSIFTPMMRSAAQKLGWNMVELSEYTNDSPMQGGGTPYPLRSPRGMLITFQFIANKAFLKDWKTYESDYQSHQLSSQQNTYSDIKSATQSPLYKRYQDSVNYYLNCYTSYVTAHQNEGTALYTKNKHLKYYQQKEQAFINKMTGITDNIQNSSGIEQAEADHDLKTYQYRNNTIVQVEFHANNFLGVAVHQSPGPGFSSSVPYPIQNSRISRLYSFEPNPEAPGDVKWKSALLILLGNFRTKPNEYGYDAGFNHNDQGDEHTPKKIKSDQVQNISISIRGDKGNVEEMAKLINVNKLIATIVKL